MLVRREVGMRDAVMPAQRVFVEKYPEITHAKRHCRKIGCEDAPAPQSTGGPPFVEAEQFQSRQRRPANIGKRPRARYPNRPELQPPLTGAGGCRSISKK